MISKVLSVCTERDISTWRTVAPYIIENIDAERHHLLVPDLQAPTFRAITPKSIEVLPESVYLGHRNIEWLKSRLPQQYHFRAGWYLQQFIKLEAASDGKPDDLNLIWDSDTLPLKPLSFITPTEEIIYYQSIEHHAAYFELIRKVLSMEKIVQFSFIAQCFPTKAKWVAELFSAIEIKSGQHWIDEILSGIDFADGCGFSEYETLGTYLTHTHLQHMRVTHAKWQRLGNSLIGGIENLTPEKARNLAFDYDFISFENWDHGQFSPQ